MNGKPYNAREARYRANKKVACCPKCKVGILIRTGCGADRLSEYFGRAVVRCDKCGTSFSEQRSNQ